VSSSVGSFRDILSADELDVLIAAAYVHDIGYASELVARVSRTADVDALTREEVQDVYDALEHPAPGPIGRAA
jgi:hypothetical protein